MDDPDASFAAAILPHRLRLCITAQPLSLFAFYPSSSNITCVYISPFFYFLPFFSTISLISFSFLLCVRLFIDDRRQTTRVSARPARKTKNHISLSSLYSASSSCVHTHPFFFSFAPTLYTSIYIRTCHSTDMTVNCARKGDPALLKRYSLDSRREELSIE